jgi:hypothetical protein
VSEKVAHKELLVVSNSLHVFVNVHKELLHLIKAQSVLLLHIMLCNAYAAQRRVPVRPCQGDSRC